MNGFYEEECAGKGVNCHPFGHYLDELSQSTIIDVKPSVLMPVVEQEFLSLSDPLGVRIVRHSELRLFEAFEWQAVYDSLNAEEE